MSLPQLAHFFLTAITIIIIIIIGTTAPF